MKHTVTSREMLNLKEALEQERTAREAAERQLAIEMEWSKALGADSMAQAAQLDQIATALGIQQRNDATDLVGPIERLTAEVERLHGRVGELEAERQKRRWDNCGSCQEHVVDLEAEVERLHRMFLDAGKIADAMPKWGHSGDEETGQHDEDCKACLRDALVACIEAALVSDANVMVEASVEEGERCRRCFDERGICVGCGPKEE